MAKPPASRHNNERSETTGAAQPPRLPPEPGGTETITGEVKIVFDEVNNSILVTRHAARLPFGARHHQESGRLSASGAHRGAHRRNHAWTTHSRWALNGKNSHAAGDRFRESVSTCPPPLPAADLLIYRSLCATINEPRILSSPLCGRWRQKTNWTFWRLRTLSPPIIPRPKSISARKCRFFQRRPPPLPPPKPACRRPSTGPSNIAIRVSFSP